MRRFGPEVVDLAFKMRCFGAFGPQNTKNLCFYLPKQRNHHEKLRSFWDAADEYDWCRWPTDRWQKKHVQCREKHEEEEEEEQE